MPIKKTRVQRSTKAPALVTPDASEEDLPDQAGISIKSGDFAPGDHGS